MNVLNITVSQFFIFKKRLKMTAFILHSYPVSFKSRIFHYFKKSGNAQIELKKISSEILSNVCLVLRIEVTINGITYVYIQVTIDMRLQRLMLDIN